MKQYITLVSLVLVISMISCKKDMNSTIDNKINNTFVDSAIQFLRGTLPDDQFAVLDIESANILRYKNDNVGLQVFEKNAPDKFVMLNKTSGGFAGNHVTISDLHSLISKDHNGIITLKALNNKYSKQLIVKDNNVVNVIEAGENGSGIVSTDRTIITQKEYQRPDKTNSTAKAQLIQLPEVVVVAYVDGDEYDYWSLYWLFDGYGPYDGIYFTSGSSGGGSSYQGGGGSGSGTTPTGNNVAAVPKFSSPDKPIAALADELKCFTSNSSSTYSVTINVNQPVPDTRDMIDPTAQFVAGHCFLTLEQTNSDGTKVVRNIGFYPKNSAKVGASRDVSVFGEDSNTPFDVPLKITVSGSELNTVENSLITDQSKNYDLDNFNCVNVVYDALNSINVHLPATSSGGVLFDGLSPADLGQDIRGLDLNNFSSQNGNKQMIRNISNTNSQKAPAKAGSC